MTMDEQASNRNDGQGVVTMADNVDGAYCFLCGTDIHNGDRIYLDLDNDQSCHYSHVGESVSYGAWLGTGVDLVGAVIVDDGEYLGYEHPYMEAQGFGPMWPGQAHYEHLTDGPTVQRFRIYESGDVNDQAGSFTVTHDQLVVEDNDGLRAWLATNPAVGDVTPWGNTRDLPMRRIV
jgi:hypothetical protein